MSKNLRPGFTVVELLLVVSIIALLVQLLIPAVNASREAARRLQCKNHLRQLGVAALTHETATRRLPSGGWGARWVGDPALGSGKRQPGGWPFNLLPYLEEKSLHDQGKVRDKQKKRVLLRRLAQSPIQVFYCPSRRSSGVYACTQNQYSYDNFDLPVQGAKCDYAANAGDYFTGLFTDERQRKKGEPIGPAKSINTSKYTGVIYHRSTVGFRHIKDGGGKTYLFGEKHLNWRHYTDGQGSGGDNEVMYVGYDFENCRWSRSIRHDQLPPLPDAEDPAYSQSEESFGGPHTSGCNFVFCDGSVRTIGFAVDPRVHRWLSNRDDGNQIDVNSL